MESRMWKETRHGKENHNKYTRCSSPFCTACADKEQNVWPQIPDTVKEICGQRGKKYEDTQSQLYAQSHSVPDRESEDHICTWMNHLYYSRPERVGELEWRVGRGAESSLASKHFPLLFQCCHCNFQWWDRKMTGQSRVLIDGGGQQRECEW